ncbi:MAG TPA: sugar transferase [Bacteroidales bacterium]|nr:sugar transferase [Bacteroidales bacterium]
MNHVRQDCQTLLKTILDYLGSMLGLVLLCPVIIILSIAILISGDGPVIYSQRRIGKSGKPFTIYKFRTMRNGEESTHLLSGKKDTRITPLGRFMRKHKLDEIPNFLNVLKGDMSIVGPRPEQKYYIDKLLLRAPQYKLIQNVKPGITSWGQVRYGYASNVDEMIERLDYDLFYLENRSLIFDLKVVIYTIGIIFEGKGI